MKLSVYAHEVGFSYRTAFRWFKSGKIQGRQMDTGTILITEPISAPQTAECPMKVAIYTRVSAAENKDDLDGLAICLRDHCAAKGYPVTRGVKEIDSGVPDRCGTQRPVDPFRLQLPRAIVEDAGSPDRSHQSG